MTMQQLREQTFGQSPHQASREAQPKATPHIQWHAQDEEQSRKQVVKCNPTKPPPGYPWLSLLGIVAFAGIVLVWSLNRCIDYSEVFVAQPKARFGIIALNSGILLLAVVLVLYCSQR